MFETNDKVIIFGPEIWPLQENGGISRYCFELINHLHELEIKVKVLISPNNNVYARRINPKLVVNLLDQSTKGLKKAIAEIMTEHESGIYHATYFDSNFIKIAKNSNLKTIVTVHDLIGEIFPTKIKWYQRRNREQEIATKISDCVVAVSENTKNDIIHYFKIEPKKINVIYLGVSEMKSSKNKELRLREPFVIHVGKRDNYKNFSLTINAISHCEKLSRLNVVAFGGGNLTTEEMKQIQSLGIASRVQHITGDDSILAMLYESAAALVYPSLYEGFGIPPLEAMRYNCPVIASNRASLPEVCGEEVLYIDPTSEESLQDALLKVLSGESGHSRDLAFQHSMTYSWKKTSIETLSLYKRVLETRR